MSGEQRQRPRLIAGFDLSRWERPFAVALGLGILTFDCYQWNSHGPSSLAFAAFISGMVLVLIGVVGLDRLSRITRLSVAPTGAVLIETAEDTRRGQVEESAAAASVAEEPTQMERDEEVPDGVPSCDTAEARPETPFTQAMQAYYIEKDYARFDELMRQAVSEASEEEETRVNLESLRLGRLCEAGQADKLEALETLRTQHPASPDPVRMLAQCYASAGEHLTAAKLYGEGYEIEGLSEDQRLIFLGRQAGALKDAKHFEEAELLLGKEFRTVDGQKGRVELHKYLAQLYEAWGRKAQVHWHLEKMLEANPGDGVTRFNLAYSYADEGHPHAAFYHYDVIGFSHASARNNMAVLLKGFDMPITAAAHYRRAAEEKMTLSAANLAKIMIGAGLVDEAKHLLDATLKEEDVHENVHRAASQMATNKDEEEKRLEKIRTGARAERQLLRDRVDAERARVDPIKAEDLTGSWQTSVGVMAFKSEGEELVARFKDGYSNWVLEGAVGGRTYLFEWKCDQPGQNKEGDGFFLFASDDRFEGLIRHTPMKGDVRLVSGSGKERSDASPTSQPS